MKALGYGFLLLVVVALWLGWQILRRVSAGAQAVINPERYAIEKVDSMYPSSGVPSVPETIPVPDSFAHTAKWEALVRYDPDVRPLAEELAPYGAQWVRRLGIDFFALDQDKSYLASIASRLKEEAAEEQRIVLETIKRNDAIFSKLKKTADGKIITEESLAVLRRAHEAGYTLAVDPLNFAISATQGEGTSYLYSNSDIQRFGRFL